MDAHDASAGLRSVRTVAHGGVKGSRNDIVGQGHGGWREGGNSVFRAVCRHFFQSLKLPVGKIRAGVAVGMNVDKAGDDAGPAQLHAALLGDGVQYLGKNTVLDPKAAVYEASVLRINISVFIKHSDLRKVFVSVRQ